MNFVKHICLMKVLAKSETGETAGRLAKRAGGYSCEMSRRQAEHALKDLSDYGYVISEVVAYRGDLVQRKYFMTQKARDTFAALAADFDKMLVQLEVK
jgi:hypothetical protein